MNPPITTPALLFCAVMQLGNELQFGRLVACILGSFAVKRQNFIRLGRPYRLKAGPEHPAQSQDTNKAFGRGSMSPKVVAIRLFLRSRHVAYRKLPHVQCLLRQCKSFSIMPKNFPVGNLAGQNISGQQNSLTLANGNHWQKRLFGWTWLDQNGSAKTPALLQHPVQDPGHWHGKLS